MAYKINFEPIGRRVPGTRRATILDIARKAGIPLTSICGGRTTCGRCKVRVLDGKVTPMGQNEKERLTEEDIAADLRLACATRVLSDLKVEIPPASFQAVQQLQLAGKEPEVAVDPVIFTSELKLPEPLLENPLADWENLRKGLEERNGLKNLRPDLSLLRDISSIMRATNWEVAAVVRDSEVIEARPQGQKLMGVAFDVGTTKIAAYLVNLSTGETLAAEGAMNPQIPYGEDVMSRITYAMEGGGEKLRGSVISTLNQLIQKVSGSPEKVVEATIVCNTAMHHLALGLPVLQLGRAPYVPAVLCPLDIKARDLGLQMANGAYVHVLPNIAGFVGADHVAVLLATGVYETEKTIIAIDIGTNTEVALARGGTITSLSCASGPAFEGAGIKQGMRATSGAIQGVKISDNTIDLSVIGGVPPIGICGSGILDVIGRLWREQIIDQRGRLRDHPLVHNSTGGREFVLASKDTTGSGEDIVVTQRDISTIQLAKAAISTGINILLCETNTKESEVDRVIITGAFGSYIDVASAVSIGMFPSLPLKRFSQVGNAAGVGSKLALISKRSREVAREIATRVRYIELTIHPRFTHEFSRSLLFRRETQKT
ncbi:ASKHA domain-containing protein [Chloroflexota bacterium]